MIRDKIKNTLLPLLFVATFAFTLYGILSYDNYYYGEPLTKLNVVIKDAPEFYFKGLTKTSFYYFTTKGYPSEFRIEEGAKDIVRENKNLRTRFENLKSGDTINIAVRTSAIETLSNENRTISVVGLAIRDTLLVDPLIVKKVDKENKLDRQFYIFLFLIILIIIVAWKYIKSKTKK